MMILVAIAILYSPGLATCKTIADSIQDGGVGQSPRWDSTHNETSCDPGYFDLNALSSLKFHDRSRMRAHTGSQNLLQCGYCDESGMPPLVSCISSGAPVDLKDRHWRCGGEIDNQHFGMSDSKIECERQEKKTSPDLDCVKKDSCVLSFSVQKRSRRDADFPNGPPVWFFLIPVGMLIFMCVMCGFCCYYGHVYRSRLLRSIPDQVVTFESCHIRTVTSSAPPAYSPPTYEATMGKDPQPS